MYRKFWLPLVVIVLVLAACGGNDDNTASDSPATEAVSEQVKATPEPTQVPDTPEPTEEPEPEIAPLSVTEEAIIGTGTIRKRAWSPDSQQLAVGSGAGVLLYDAADLSAEPTLLRINGGAWASAYSPDGSMLATSNVDVPIAFEDNQFVHLWDLATGERIAEFTTGRDRVETLVFSSDGTLLVGAVRGIVYVWDAATLDVVEEITFEGNKPFAVAISPDNTRIAWGLSDGLHLYTRDTGEDTVLPYGDQNMRSAYFVDFSPDGSYVAAGSTLYTPLVFDLASGEMVYQGGDDRVGDALRYDADGNLVITDSSTIKTINPLTGEEVASIGVKEGLLSPDGAKIAALDGLRLVMIDAASEEELSASDLRIFDKPPLVLPDFSVIIARQTSSSRLRLLDPADGSLIETVTLSSGVQDDAITLSPDGSHLAAYSRGDTVLVVDTETWEEIAVLEHETSMKTLALNSNSTQIAFSVTLGNTPLGVGLLDAATGEEQWFTELEKETAGLIFSLDDSQVIGVTHEGLFVFDAATGEILHEINREDQPGGKSFTYTPDESALVLYGDTGFFPGAFINFYDPATYELIESVPGNHNYGVTGVAFSADGTKMITVGRDIMLNQWDAAARQLVAQAGVLPDAMQGVAALNAEATRLVTTSSGGVLQLWSIGTE